MTDLFEAYTRARSADPETSHEAAEKAIPDKTRKQRIILYWLTEHPKGLTDWELEEIENDHRSTWRTRRAELTEMGLVRDSGERRKIKGRNRIVWKLAAQPIAETPF